MTPAQIARIRELRYGDGLTLPATARIIGCCTTTVQRHAPGRPGKIPVALLREAFEASHRTAADVARSLGWFGTHGSADSSRVLRMMGINVDVHGAGHHCFRLTADAEVVARAAEALGLSAWEVGA